MHLRPIQFVDTPVGRDGEVARLAGGMLWFAAYEVTEDGRRRTVTVADFDKCLGQNDAAVTVHRAMTAPRAALALGERIIRFDQPHVVGILNLTPDSFSDGGALHDDPVAAATAGFDLVAKGASMIDLGGESTRPGATPVWEGDEVKRVVPVVERLVKSGAIVSVDTRKASVMAASLAVGAHIINDVSALVWDDRALEVVAQANCPVILMHSPDPAKGPHGGTGYDDIVTDVFDWLSTRIAAVTAAGIDQSRLIVDPGIGFGKGLAENLALLNGLAMLHGLGCPVMLGASRKRMIGALSNEAPVGDRLGGSLALALKGAEAGVQLLRVHDVADTVQALRVWRGCKDQALVGR